MINQLFKTMKPLSFRLSVTVRHNTKGLTPQPRTEEVSTNDFKALFRFCNLPAFAHVLTANLVLKGKQKSLSNSLDNLAYLAAI